jgi:hypothetical protein
MILNHPPCHIPLKYRCPIQTNDNMRRMHIPIRIYKPHPRLTVFCNLLNCLSLNLTRAHYYSRWITVTTWRNMTAINDSLMEVLFLSKFLTPRPSGLNGTMLQCCFRSGWSITIKLIMCTRLAGKWPRVLANFYSWAWICLRGWGGHEILIWNTALPGPLSLSIYPRLQHRASFTWRSEDLILSMRSHTINLT